MIPFSRSLPLFRRLRRSSIAVANVPLVFSLLLFCILGCIFDTAKPANGKWNTVSNNLSLPPGPVFLFARGDSLVALSGAMRGATSGIAVSVSGDGKEWRVRPQADVGPVSLSNAVVYRDTLWAIGPGTQAAEATSDSESRSSLWKSADGAYWVEVLPSAPFGDRLDAGFLATDNGLWLVSGRTKDAAPFVFPGTWYSEDGDQWVNVGLEEDPFANAASAIGFGSRIFVIGGGNQTDSTPNLNIRSSADGIVWNANAPSVGLLPRWNPCLAEHAGKLWMLGGDPALASVPSDGFKDVWSSVDGWLWILEDAEAPFNAGTGRAAVSWRGHLWVVTSPREPGMGAEIWSSSR